MNKQEISEYAQTMGRKGGNRTKNIMSKDYYKEIGRKGGQSKKGYDKQELNKQEREILKQSLPIMYKLYQRILQDRVILFDLNNRYDEYTFLQFIIDAKSKLNILDKYLTK